MLGDGVPHQARAQLQMLFVDVRCGTRHPQRAVFHLLAKIDEKGMVVVKFEATARELADQRRHVEPSLELAPHHRELAQHLGDG